jgi:phage terminase small subunit
MVKREDRKLTARQRRFVAEYLIDLNATQAAIRAGFAPGSAKVTASRLLTNPNLAAEIERRQAAHLRALELKAAEAIALNAERARFDPAELLDAEGNLLPIHRMPLRVRRVLKKFKLIKRNLTAGDGQVDTLYEIEWSDAQRAIELDYRRHGLFTEKVELSGSLDLVATRLVEARKRLAQTKAGM